MNSIIAIARHDLKLTLADRSAVMWLFIMPVAFATFFGLVMGGGGGGAPSDPKAALSVLDHDGTAVSRAFISALASERLDLEEISNTDATAHEDRVRTLVIPEGFGDKVLAGTQVTVRLEKEPGTSAEAALVAQARITAAIARLIAQLVEASEVLPKHTPLTSELLAAVPTPADLVTIEARFAGRARVVPDGFTQSVPGNAVMFVMLVALTYGAASITLERQNGLLRRLATAPLTRPQLIAGKMMGRLVIAALQVTVFVAMGQLAQSFFHIEIGNLAAVWVVLMVFAITVAPLGLLFGAFFKDPDRAASVGVIATMVMAAFGGCWWPLEIVSRPLKMVALVFPSGWAMQALHGVISFGHGLSGVLPSLAVLFGFFLLFAVLAARSLRID